MNGLALRKGRNSLVMRFGIFRSSVCSGGLIVRVVTLRSITARAVTPAARRGTEISIWRTPPCISPPGSER